MCGTQSDNRLPILCKSCEDAIKKAGEKRQTGETKITANMKQKPLDKQQSEELLKQANPPLGYHNQQYQQPCFAEPAIPNNQNILHFQEDQNYKNINYICQDIGNIHLLLIKIHKMMAFWNIFFVIAGVLLGLIVLAWITWVFASAISF